MQQNFSSNLVPADYAMQFIPDTPALYKAILRNQLLVPPLKDAICTKDFLIGLLEKRYWCPLTQEVSIRNCADMPSKKELATMLYEAMAACTTVDDQIQSQFVRTAELVLKHPPSQSWTLIMISTVQPDHPIFAKAWQKPKFVPMAATGQGFVPSFAGFFDGLPMEQRTKKAGRISFVNKAD